VLSWGFPALGTVSSICDMSSPSSDASHRAFSVGDLRPAHGNKMPYPDVPDLSEGSPRRKVNACRLIFVASVC
jgi:hypothetical protein